MVDLKRFIEERNINKVALSGILGISRATLDNWLEGGKPENLNKIAESINRYAENMMVPGTKRTLPSNVIVTESKNNSGIQGNTGSAAISGAPPVIINAGPAPETAEMELLRNENVHLKQRIADLEGIIKMKDEMIVLLKTK